jgi:hypothetical protein
MSHVTTLKGVQIKDVAAMRAAVAELKAKGINCDLLENAKPRMYYDHQSHNRPFVLRLGDSRYDVGFVPQDDGTYAPEFDEWDRQVTRQIGATCPLPDTKEGRVQHCIGQFLQGYAKHAAMNAAMSQGYIIEGSTTDAEGNVHLQLGLVG